MKRLLQHFIVKTSVGPLSWAYRACYAIALKRIVHVLKKQPEIVAVYLVGGMATGSYIPGLSDIDVIIIIKDVEGGKQRVRRCCEQISRSIPLLSRSEQAVYSVEEIKREYTKGNFHIKYKLFTECKKQGKLLYGTDVLRDFEELGALQRNEFIISHLGLMWIHFLKKFLVKGQTTDELLRNYSCYKFTSYACGALISVNYGQRTISNKRKTIRN